MPEEKHKQFNQVEMIKFLHLLQQLKTVMDRRRRSFGVF